RRRHTRSTRDWSSDVCSSDLFALAIPELPEPLRREVGVAYLLFRIADTFEDATRWPRADRLAALAAFDRLLGAPTLDEARVLAEIGRASCRERAMRAAGHVPT